MVENPSGILNETQSTDKRSEVATTMVEEHEDDSYNVIVSKSEATLAPPLAPILVGGKLGKPSILDFIKNEMEAQQGKAQ